MRTVESWSNNLWGWNLRRLRLQVNDAGVWQVNVRYDRDEITLDFRTEADARTELALLLSEHGPWTRIG